MAEIVIPKSLRLDWVAVMAFDQELSGNAFRGRCGIGFHFNRFSGRAFLRADTITKLLKISTRTAWTGVKELETAGYLIITRREIGYRTKKDGKSVRVFGGRGRANIYRLALVSSQAVASKLAEKLVTICEHTEKRSWKKRVPMHAASCVPTLTSPT